MGLGPDARLAGDKPRRYVFFSCFRTNDTVGGRISGARRIEQHTGVTAAIYFAPTRAEIFGRWAVMLSPFGQLEKKVAGVGRSRTHPETRRRPRNGFEDREDHQIPSTPKTARIICWKLSGYDY